MSSEQKSISYHTVREEWSVYRLEGGTTLKVKHSVSMILADKAEQRTSFSYTNVSYLYAVSEDKGKPSEGALQDSDTLGDSKFEVISEPWNIYETEAKTLIFVLPKLKRVRKTGKFNKDGNRVYIYDSEIIVSLMPYPKEGETSFNDVDHPQ